METRIRQSYTNKKLWMGILGMFTLMFLSNMKSWAQCSDSQCDRDVLTAFYNATDGANWTNGKNTNWLSSDMSTWTGVKIDANGRVYELRLSNGGLDGTVPDSINMLSELKILDLSTNPDLTGNLNLLTMYNLTQVNVSGCSFSAWQVGSSHNYYPNLKYLYLSGTTSFTQFSGPLNIGGMPDLISLYADRTGFTQLILHPNQSTNSYYYDGLSTLVLDYSQFTGDLDISNMTSLKKLRTVSNQFSTLTKSNATSFYSLLEEFGFQGLSDTQRQFSGTLDIANCPKLKSLSLQFVGFTEILSGTTTFNDLAYVNIINSDVGGTLDVSGMPKLTYLTSYNTNFTALTTNATAGYYADLTDITIYGSGSSYLFGGTLDISGMPNLVDLTASQTNFEVLEVGTTTYGAMEFINLNSARFEGELDISKMTALKQVSATHTNLESIKSDAATNYTAMHTLLCNDSKLKGTLNLSKMTALTTLDATDNKLTGLSMSTQAGGYFQIENNRLTFEDLVPNESYLPSDSNSYTPQSDVGKYEVYNLNCTGKDITLNVEVDLSVSGIVIQWYKRSLSGGSFTLISGETGTTLTILEGASDKEGVYQYWLTHPDVPGTIKSRNKVVHDNTQQ